LGNAETFMTPEFIKVTWSLSRLWPESYLVSAHPKNKLFLLFGRRISLGLVCRSLYLFSCLFLLFFILTTRNTKIYKNRS